MTTLYPFLATVLAYLLGSLSFAVIVSRVMGLQDPRSYGSRNPGATNVLRTGHKLAAALTLLLDALKGWLPMVLVRWFGKPYGLEDGTLALVGMAAFAGHLAPVFFGFQGGKGVATAAGVLLGIDFFLGLAVLLTWLAVAGVWRYSSLAALLSAGLAPVYYQLGGAASRLVLLAIFLMGMALVYRHRDNINRLLAGTESRIGNPKNRS